MMPVCIQSQSDYGTFWVEWNYTQKISSNLRFHHLFSKHLARLERVIEMLSVGWELYQNCTILTLVVSIILQLTYHSTYKDTQWKANKFPPLCSRPGITSTSWAAKTTSPFTLSSQSVQPRTTLEDWLKKWEGPTRNPITASFQRHKGLCSF